MIFRDDECFGLLEIYRSVLLSKGVFKAGKIRTTDNASESQKDIYHLALLTTLNLGAINRQPLIGGTKKFPSWIRKDPSCVVLPHLIFKNGAHIAAWCEASDAHGGIAIHQDLARDNAMLGMVVNAELQLHHLPFFSNQHMKLEVSLNSSASISAKLKTRSRRTSSGFFTAVFSDWHLEESLLVKW